MVWARPILIDSLDNPKRVTPLDRRVPRPGSGEPSYREILIQQLVHSVPECLPIQEIEPAFVGLRSVCTELRLRRGTQDRYADNLLINPDGLICLVECKLANNSAADRDVLAQLIDYAGALAELNYEGLLALVRKAGKRPEGDPIVEAVLGASADPDQREDLIAGIERSLRRSRLLLLIIGDRIRSNTEELVDLLQERVNLGFTFGLVEMPIYSAGSVAAGYFVQPRVLLKTKIVTRTVFVASDPQREVVVRGVEQTEPASSLSEQEFNAALSKVDPLLVPRLRDLLQKCADDYGCTVRLMRQNNLYMDDNRGGEITVATFIKDGTVQFWGNTKRDEALGRPVVQEYLREVAAALPGGVAFSEAGHPFPNVRVNDRTSIPLALLLDHQAAWLNALANLRQALQTESGDPR